MTSSTRTSGHPSRHQLPNAIAVIGLGRFGGALARELMRNGSNVLGLDVSDSVVQSFNGQLSTVIRGDATDESVLTDLGIDQFDKVVVGIGTDVQASILTASRLVKFGCPAIWAKAITEPHAEILEQLGVHHVVKPEQDMGIRAAHLIQDRIKDFLPIDHGFALIRCTPPEPVQQRPLDLLRIRKKFGVSVVALRRPEGDWEPVEPASMLYEDDEILVTGPTRKVEAFSGLS